MILRSSFVGVIAAIVFLMAGNVGCGGGDRTGNPQSYVDFRYGLAVAAVPNKYPALNETAAITVTFNFVDWYRDTLQQAGIDSVTLGPIYYVQENSQTVYDAFAPRSGEFLWSAAVPVVDTITWTFEITPLHVGKFDLTIGIGVVGLSKLDSALQDRLAHAYGIMDLYLCVETERGCSCPPHPPGEGTTDSRE